MSDLLDQAIAHVRELPSTTQEEVAQLLLEWVGKHLPEVDDMPVQPVDPAHLVAIEEGLEDARAGRIASDAEVEAAFAAFQSGR